MTFDVKAARARIEAQADLDPSGRANHASCANRGALISTISTFSTPPDAETRNTNVIELIAWREART